MGISTKAKEHLNALKSDVASDLLEINTTMKDIKADLNTLFSAVFNHLMSRPSQPKSIHEMALFYEKACDQLIREAKGKERLNYISGSLSMLATSEDLFVCAAELYFTDPHDKWVLKKTSSREMSISDCLKEEAQLELTQKRKVAFEITDPEGI